MAVPPRTPHHLQQLPQIVVERGYVGMICPKVFLKDCQGAFHVRPCRLVLPHRFQQLP
jgi:hypothetical protein